MADEPEKKPETVTFGPVDSRIIRKAQTGGGQTPAGRQKYDEIGRTGLRHWGGFVFEEWLRDLQGRRGAEAYRELSDSDPVVGGCMLAIETLVKKVEWWVEPASEAAADEAAAEFYEQVLFDDLDCDWADQISETLSMLIYGWAWFEIVWKQRRGDVRDPRGKSKFTDGRIGVRKLALRAQDALWQWEFDPETDELVAMTQQPPPDYTPRTIPLEKSLLFRTKVFKDNPEGRSMLRNAYESYYMLKGIRALEGIGIERDLAGLPVLSPPEGVDIWNTNDPAMQQYAQKAQELVSSIRRDEQEGILLPRGWELTLLSAGPGGSKRAIDPNVAIVRYEQRIATSMLADLILLGQDKVGSYALSASKESLFAAVIDTQLDSIASVYDAQLAPKLFRLNAFPGMTGLPKLRHGNVQDVDLSTIAAFLKSLADSGAPLWPNQEALEKLFERAGLPKPPDDLSEQVPMKPRAAAGDATDDEIDTGDDGPPDDEPVDE